MKKQKLRLALAALAITIVTAFSRVTNNTFNENQTTGTYHWYYLNTLYTGHYHSIEFEADERGLYLETECSNCTPALKGFFDYNCTWVGLEPVPNDWNSPDVILYYY